MFRGFPWVYISTVSKQLIICEVFSNVASIHEPSVHLGYWMFDKVDDEIVMHADEISKWFGISAVSTVVNSFPLWAGKIIIMIIIEKHNFKPTAAYRILRCRRCEVFNRKCTIISLAISWKQQHIETKKWIFMFPRPDFFNSYYLSYPGNFVWTFRVRFSTNQLPHKIYYYTQSRLWFIPHIIGHPTQL